MSNAERFLPLKPVVLHILLSLAEDPMHGYGIIQSIRQRTEGEVQVHTGPLYRHLRRLLDEGLIEVGVRMAFGAGEGQIAKLIVGRGALLALGGVALGIGGALLLTRSLSSLLYGVEPTDPVTFGALALFLTAVAVAASWIPARRAARVDPVDALGAE